MLRVNALAFALAIGACSAHSNALPPPVDDPAAAQATKDRIVAVVQPQLDALVQAATEMRDAAPPDRGWDPTLDAVLIETMKQTWMRAHDAYEHAEVAVEPLFADEQLGIDGRYEVYMTSGERERNPFDDRIVVGLHAVERILWYDSIPQYVLDFEDGIPLGFRAALPADASQASLFKTQLLNRLVAESTHVRDLFASRLDLGRVFGGLVASLQEQKDDVSKRAFGQDESRYSQRSMVDLRSQLEGARAVYGAYRPWLLEWPDGADVDGKIASGFDALASAYAAIDGDAIPAGPKPWKPLHPSDADLATTFGRLFSAASTASATATDGSLAFELNVAATGMALPPYPEDP